MDFVLVACRGRAGGPVKSALWRMKLLPASILEAFSVHSLRIKGGGAEEGPRRTGPICIVDLEQQTNERTDSFAFAVFSFAPLGNFPAHLSLSPFPFLSFFLSPLAFSRVCPCRPHLFTKVSLAHSKTRPGRLQITIQKKNCALVLNDY